MAFSHNGIEFIVPIKTEEELEGFDTVGNVMSYVEGAGSPNAFLYANGINYATYDPVQWDINNGGDGNVSILSEIEVDGWDLIKLNTDHSVLFPGKPASFGQRVYGYPIGLYNPTGSPVDYFLQFSHSSSVEVAVIALNMSNSTMKLNVTLGEFKVLDDTLDNSFYIGEKLVLSRQQGSSESLASVIDPDNPIVPVTNDIIVSYEDTINSLNPTAFWRMNDTSATSIAADETGVYDGEYINGPLLNSTSLITDDVNTSTRFSIDENTYVKVPNSGSLINTGSPFTVSMLVNRISPHPTGLSTLLSAVTDAEDFSIFDGTSAAGFYQISFGSGSAWVSAGSDDVTIVNSTTYHLSVTYNGNGATDVNNFNLYIDGAKLILVAAGTLTGHTSLDTQIGRLANLDINGFNGLIDDVSIIPKELTELEAKNIYNASVNIIQELPAEPSSNLATYNDTVNSLIPTAYYRLGEIGSGDPFALDPPNPTVVDDDFTGDDGDAPDTNLWSTDISSLYNITSSLDVQLNKLKFAVTGDINVGASVAKLESKYEISGDFDIQMDVSDVISTSNRGQIWLRILGVGWLSMSSENSVDMWTTNFDGSQPSVSRTNSFGEIRITRVGNISTGYYDDGSTGTWTQWLQDLNCSTDDVSINIELYDNSATGVRASSGFIDNFRINSGTIVWPSPVDDDFTGVDGYAPNTELWNSTVDEIDSGKLVKTLISTGGSTVSKFTIAGDFDIQVYADYTGTFNGSGYSGLRLNMPDTTNAYLYNTANSTSLTYARKTTPGGSSTNNAVTIVSTNGIYYRFTRSGTTIKWWYDLGAGFVEMFSASYPTAGNVSVNLNLYSTTTNDAHRLDNFKVNSGTIVWPNTAFDETGTYDGTYGGSPTQGVPGLLIDDIDTAVTFGGGIDYVLSPFRISTTEFSVSFIINYQVLTTSDYAYAQYSGGHGARLAIGTDPTGLRMGFQVGGVTAYSDGDMVVDTTYHFVFTRNASGVCMIYKDSVAQSITAVNALVLPDVDTVIGGLTAGATGIDGTMDEVVIYSRELSAQEVADLYSSSQDTLEATPIVYSEAINDLLPVAYWRLGEATPGTGAAVDETGNYDGTYVGSPIGTTGLLVNDGDTAVSFDGSSQYIDSLGIETVIGFTGSISALIQIDPSSITASRIFCVNDNASNSNRFLFTITSNGFLGIYASIGLGTLNGISSTVDLRDGNIHNVVASSDSSIWRLYVDGIEITDTNVLSSNTGTWVGNLTVKNSSTIGVEYLNSAYSSEFDGIIDEVAIFETALTSAQVAKLYSVSINPILAPETIPYIYKVKSLAPITYWRLGETDVSISLDDDFTGTDGDAPDPAKWIESATVGPTYEIISNKLKVAASTTGVGNAYIRTVYSFSGDYDIQIDITNATGNTGTATTWSRFRFGTSQLSVYYGIAHNNGEVEWTVSGSGLYSVHKISGQGKARIRRVGNTITGWIWNNSRWEWLGNTAGISATCTETSTVANLQVTTAGFTNVWCYFDNFIVNVGNVVNFIADDEMDNYNAVYRTDYSSVPGLVTADTDTAVGLSGVNQYLDASSDIRFIDATNDLPFSLSAIIKLDSIGDNLNGIISKWHGTDSIDGEFGFNVDSTGLLTFQIMSQTTTDRLLIKAIDPILINTIYLVTATYDGSKTIGGLNIYINEARVGVAETVEGTYIGMHDSSGASKITIGANIRNDAFYKRFLDGTIDEVAIYDKELTALEVAELYSSATKTVLIVDTGEPLVGALIDYPTAVGNHTPTAYWRLGETTFTAAAMLDAVGAYNGTYIGTPSLEETGLLTSDIDTAVLFDGVNDRAEAPVLDLGAVWTLSALIRVDSLSVDTYIASNEDGTGLYINTSGLLTWVDVDTTFFAKTLVTGVSYHIVLVSDAGALTLYVNSIADNISPILNILAASNFYPYNIGSDSDGLNTFAGVIDDVYWTNSGLSGINVSDMYNASKGIPSAIPTSVDYQTAVNELNPVAYWRLGEQSGPAALDETSNNNGAYVGSPVFGEQGLLSGDANTSVAFNGAGNKVDSFSVVAGVSHTVTCLIRLSSLNDYQNIITGGNDGLNIWNTNRLIWATGATGAVSGILDTGIVYHCAAVIDGTNVTLYLNGLEVATGTNGTSVTYTNIAENIASREFNGTIDEVAIFNTALTAINIASLYNTSIKGVSSYRPVQVLEKITGLTSVSGGTIPEIEVYAGMKEYECTVTSVTRIGDNIEIDVHIDDAYTEEEISKVVYLSPYNQEMRIFPLGNGDYVPHPNPLIGAGSLLNDTFIDIPGDHSLVSWVYNDNTSAMSTSGKLSTPIMKFTLEPGEVYKFMLISWKDEDTSLFSNGFYTRIFG